MTDQTPEQVPGQQTLDAEPIEATPDPTPGPALSADAPSDAGTVSAPATIADSPDGTQPEPDPTPADNPGGADTPDASSQMSAAVGVSTGDPDSGEHRFRIIHEIHRGDGRPILRIGGELAQDAVSAIAFLSQFVTKS